MCSHFKPVVNIDAIVTGKSPSVAIKRRGKDRQVYYPSKASLNRLAKVIRESGSRFLVTPFANGWHAIPRLGPE